MRTLFNGRSSACPLTRRHPWTIVSRTARLQVVLLLNLLLVTMLVAVGLSAHSLSVFAEGADFLADAGGIGVALLAIWLSERPPTPRSPDGHPRAPALAALVNGGWLLVVSLLVIAGAIDRLVSTTGEVDGLPVLVVSGVAAVVMLGGALVLGGDVGDLQEGDINGDLTMRAVLLDTAADAAAASGVAVTGGVILATGGLYWLDPAVALTISAVVAYHAIQLLRRVVGALSAATVDSADVSTKSGAL
jgi:cobalt-zinc-cadmium efflux system protein